MIIVPLPLLIRLLLLPRLCLTALINIILRVLCIVWCTEHLLLPVAISRTIIVVLLLRLVVASIARLFMHLIGGCSVLIELNLCLCWHLSRKSIVAARSAVFCHQVRRVVLVTIKMVFNLLHDLINVLLVLLLSTHSLHDAIIGRSNWLLTRR